MKEWMYKHKEVIENFLLFLNKESDNYILKGGTSLMMCYNLDRFSEDIDLDAVHKSNTIKKIVENFCGKNGYSFRIAKDTDIVKRYMINYSEEKNLKVEISFRRKELTFKDKCDIINGIRVYNINELCGMKSSAYLSRDKIRDLYDVAFICNNYWDEISESAKSVLRNALEYKGIEQFDYMIATQKDELIDEDKLTESFLMMFEKLGLLYSDNTVTHKLNELNVTCDKIEAFIEDNGLDHIEKENTTTKNNER